MDLKDYLTHDHDFEDLEANLNTTSLQKLSQKDKIAKYHSNKTSTTNFSKVLKFKDKDEEDGISLNNSFFRLNNKRLIQKKLMNLEQWQSKADHKIVFKVDQQQT